MPKRYGMVDCSDDIPGGVGVYWEAEVWSDMTRHMFEAEARQDFMKEYDMPGYSSREVARANKIIDGVADEIDWDNPFPTAAHSEDEDAESSTVWLYG